MKYAVIFSDPDKRVTNPDATEEETGLKVTPKLRPAGNLVFKSGITT